MDLRNFKAGTYKKQGDFKTLSPSKINIQWVCSDPNLVVLLEEANRALGEFNAFSHIVPNVDLFIKMHIVKEATQSSRIEGTRTRIDEALMDKGSISPEKQEDWQDVQNYIAAMNHAIGGMKKLPLCNRLIREAHSVLMQGVRGSNKAPGEFRKVQNWIGGQKPSEARHVPPEPTEVPDLMKDLEAFLHNDDIKVPHLVRIALAHYQFETIHPFLDGNGRTGRLLILLYLIENKILQKPTLYLSDYLEKKRQEYFDSLNEARKKNDMIQWIKFFLGAVTDTSQKGYRTFENILSLWNELDAVVHGMGARAKNAGLLLSALFQTPLLELDNKTKIGGMSNRTLRYLVDEFQKQGILEERTGQRRNRAFAFKRYLSLF
jgi:Fic family protein